MKVRTNTLRKLGALTFAGILGTGSALAATTSSKGGMQTTESYATGSSDLPMLAPGVQELGLSGFLNWEDETRYALNVSYGRFVTSNWLLGGQIGIDGQNSDAGMAVGVFAEYNFLTGTKWVPFIGIAFDYNRLEGDDGGLNSFRTGAEFGVKYFMRPNMAITMAAGGAWNTNSLPEGDDFQKQINLGLRYYF